MTPSQVIDNVLLSLERADLRQAAETNFYTAIKAAHSSGRFVRDRKIRSITEFCNLQGIIYGALPTEIRDILGIKQYASFCTTPSGCIMANDELGLTCEFRNGSASLEIRDYYGYVYPYTYIISGRQLLLKGVDSATLCIGVDAICWPTFYFDEGINDFVSDSWILSEFPQLVEAFLTLTLAKMSKDDKAQVSAINDIATYRAELLTVYSGDSL